MKIYIKGLKQEIALGDVVKKIIDPNNRYNCPRCQARQKALNDLLTVARLPEQPLPRPYQMPVEKPEEEDGQS